MWKLALILTIFGWLYISLLNLKFSNTGIGPIDSLLNHLHDSAHSSVISLSDLLLNFYQGYFWLGIFAGVLLFIVDADDDSKIKKRIYWFVFFISIMPALAKVVAGYVASGIQHDVQIDESYLWFWVGCCIASLAAAGYWLRIGVQYIEVLAKKLTKSSRVERNKMTDIRTIHEHLPHDKQRFDPLKYINKKKGVFVGLSEEDMPIYIKYSDWETSHLMLTGRTRSGKGISAQSIGYQSIKFGELLVILDPKLDNFMPHVFKKACEEADKPYVLLDLRQSAHPQINMFEGCDNETLENVLIAAFGFSPKGDIADAYRALDRKAARQAAGYVSNNPGASPKEVLDALGAGWKEKDESGLTAMMCYEMFSEMAELPAVNRKGGTGGVDIKKLVETGGCLYVVGDMMNSRVITMQRMILIRLLMIAKNRPQNDGQRIIRVMADEYRVHISRPFIVSLGASAGWRLLSILAFQSFEDLRDCPADLDPDMVRGASLENCALQLSYRIKDDETAEALAACTGEILVDVEVKDIDRNAALVETVGGRSIRQSQRWLIDKNMIKSLPIPDNDKKTIGCGVLIGASQTAQFCFTSPVMVECDESAIKPTTLPPAASEIIESTSERLMSLPDLPDNHLADSAP